MQDTSHFLYSVPDRTCTHATWCMCLHPWCNVSIYVCIRKIVIGYIWINATHDLANASCPVWCKGNGEVYIIIGITYCRRPGGSQTYICCWKSSSVDISKSCQGLHWHSILSNSPSIIYIIILLLLRIRIPLHIAISLWNSLSGIHTYKGVFILPRSSATGVN